MLGVLVLTYLVLLRAFRSLVLPLKAVLLNVLTVAAVYGLLVVIFRWGAGAHLLGLYRVDQIEGWIPIFLFAVLFGLSMDYEVFLVSRMRESWDHVHDNKRAVAHGLERTGRIITAAALIMVAAFSGFVAGRVAGLQEFGLGLALAVLHRRDPRPDDPRARRFMAVIDRYNWWLPARIARLARVQASPLVEEGRGARPPRERKQLLDDGDRQADRRQLVAERESRERPAHRSGREPCRTACSDTTAAACRAAGTCRSGACRALRSRPGS